MVAPEILKSLQQVIQRFGFAGALRRVGLCDERALSLDEGLCPRNRLCHGAGHEVCRVGLSLLVSLDILLTRSPLPADAKRVGKLESSASGFARWSSPTGLQPNGELVIAGRALRCGRVLNVLDPSLDNLGLAARGVLVFNPHLLDRTPTPFAFSFSIMSVAIIMSAATR